MHLGEWLSLFDFWASVRFTPSVRIWAISTAFLMNGNTNLMWFACRQMQQYSLAQGIERCSEVGSVDNYGFELSILKTALSWSALFSSESDNKSSKLPVWYSFCFNLTDGSSELYGFSLSLYVAQVMLAWRMRSKSASRAVRSLTKSCSGPSDCT